MESLICLVRKTLTSFNTKIEDTYKISLKKKPVRDIDLEIMKENLGLAKVDYLKQMCRTKGLKVAGKKQDLIHRLENPTLEESKSTSKGGGKKKKSVPCRNIDSIMEKLQGKLSSLPIRKNNNGDYEHVQTGLIFNPDTKKAVSRMRTVNGMLIKTELNKNDVELCISMKIPYKLPENLDTGTRIKIKDDKLKEELGEEDFKEDEASDDEAGDEEDGA